MTSAVPYAEVIGDPVAQSKSPAIHLFWLRKLGIEGDYRACRVERGGLPRYLAERLADPFWRGCNVTMPLKLEALDAVGDDCLERARTAGAANILFRLDGRLYADNSDVIAVETVVRDFAGETRPQDITLLGTGGASRAALAACRSLGLDRVTIQGRNLMAARALADKFQLASDPVLLGSPVRSRGLINATPLGMTGAVPLSLDIDDMPEDGWVFDMITSPAETRLVKRAAQRGLKSGGGLAMLVEQAAVAFRTFFGTDAPREHDAELQGLLTS